MKHAAFTRVQKQLPLKVTGAIFYIYRKEHFNATKRRK